LARELRDQSCRPSILGPSHAPNATVDRKPNVMQPLPQFIWLKLEPVPSRQMVLSRANHLVNVGPRHFPVTQPVRIVESSLSAKECHL
jgi:hypothetical protein